MSLIPRHQAAALAKRDSEPLPNPTSVTYVIGEVRAFHAGHSFGDFRIITTGSPGTHIGDHIEMCESIGIHCFA